MTDLILRIEKHIKYCEHNLTGNRPVVTLLHEAAQEIQFLRKQVSALQATAGLPGVITRDAQMDRD
jgi:hypothetical protein